MRCPRDGLVGVQLVGDAMKTRILKCSEDCFLAQYMDDSRRRIQTGYFLGMFWPKEEPKWRTICERGLGWLGDFQHFGDLSCRTIEEARRRIALAKALNGFGEVVE